MAAMMKVNRQPLVGGSPPNRPDKGKTLARAYLTAWRGWGNELAQLMGQVYDCCSNQPQLRQSENSVEENLAGGQKTNFLLNQNDPNPFSSSTYIRYVIPESTKSASLIIFDSNGRTINRYQLSERGNGIITIYGSDVVSGVYYYSLVLDGKISDTKRMVRID